MLPNDRMSNLKLNSTDRLSAMTLPLQFLGHSAFILGDA
jgi:hypothetical protein